MEKELQRRVKEIINDLKYEEVLNTFLGDIKITVYRCGLFDGPNVTKVRGVTKYNDELCGCTVNINMDLIRDNKEFAFAIEQSLKELVRNITNYKYGMRL